MIHVCWECKRTMRNQEKWSEKNAERENQGHTALTLIEKIGRELGKGSFSGRLLHSQLYQGEVEYVRNSLKWIVDADFILTVRSTWMQMLWVKSRKKGYAIQVNGRNKVSLESGVSHAISLPAHVRGILEEHGCSQMHCGGQAECLFSMWLLLKRKGEKGICLRELANHQSL